MTRKKIVDEISDYRTRPTRSARDHATAQYRGLRVPLDVERTARGVRAVQFHPAGLAARLFLARNLKTVLVDSLVVRNCLTKTSALGAEYLNQNLHLNPPVISVIRANA
jgi:hypothetical protein